MPVVKTNHFYDLDRCLVEWEFIQMRMGMKLYDNDEVLGTGIYGQRRQTCLQQISANNKLDWLEGTVFADIIRDVDGERSRIMEMNSYTTYSVHKDKSPRYHLALTTNPNAYFIFPTLNEIMHIPADGCLYEVDTTKPHSFVNCGPDRTHLVISKRSSS